LAGTKWRPAVQGVLILIMFAASAQFKAGIAKAKAEGLGS
jgi:hypothetical protein